MFRSASCTTSIIPARSGSAPPETTRRVEALPVETLGYRDLDLIHHKFVVRDELDVWTRVHELDGRLLVTAGENVIVRALGARPLAHAFRLEFDALWSKPVAQDLASCSRVR